MVGAKFVCVVQRTLEHHLQFLRMIASDRRDPRRGPKGVKKGKVDNRVGVGEGPAGNA
jgi:hypothetical protein